MGRSVHVCAFITTAFLALSDAAIAQDRSRTANSYASSNADAFWSGDFLFRAQEESPYDEPLATDRPDFTEASSSVGRGVIQLESGYTYTYDDDDANDIIRREHSGPEIVLRYGLTDRIEARLVWNYLWESNRENGVDQFTDGADDLTVGSKVEITDEEGWIPESAVILHLITPTGGGAFSNHHVESQINYCYGWDLTEETYLAASTGHTTATDDAVDRYNQFHQSASVGTSLTEKLGFYIEYFGLYFDGREDDVPENYVDGGFTFQFDYNNQFDIRAGKGLNEAADDFFGGVGMSFRR